jgi:hypothetical protein
MEKDRKVRKGKEGSYGLSRNKKIRGARTNIELIACKKRRTGD